MVKMDDKFFRKVTIWAVSIVTIIAFIPPTGSLIARMFGYYTLESPNAAQQLGRYAYEKDNPRICERIIFPFTIQGPGSSRGDLKRACMGKFISLKNYDIAVCDEFDEQFWKENCIDVIATVTKNRELCYRLTNAQEKEWCLEDSIDYSNKESCLLFEGDQNNMDTCYIRHVEITGDINVCLENVVGKDRKDNCIDTAAWKLKNPNFCNKIKDEEKQKKCRAAIDFSLKQKTE
jgi:hypothetical protein